MSRDFKILTWMVPVTFPDGLGFRTIVSPQDGYYVLISEMRRGRIDETLCFPCDSSGEPIRLTEIAGGWDTSSALEDLKSCWTLERHRGTW